MAKAMDDFGQRVDVCPPVTEEFLCAAVCHVVCVSQFGCLLVLGR
jgi:hypothetical protein